MNENLTVCPECGGTGSVIVGTDYVTLDMAIDAGDRELEGTFFGYRYGACPLCQGGGLVEKVEDKI